MDVKKQFEELKNHFEPNNWKVENERLVADNLVIYFRQKFNEWRLGMQGSMMDITSINFPFNEEEKFRIQKLCSENHKSL